MRVYEIQRFGTDHLKLTDRPDPEPGHGQIRLQMKAWSLNYRDLLVVNGQYNPKMKLPMIPFSDGVGEVVEVGSGVTRFKKGDRAAGIFMQGWLHGPYEERYAATAAGGALSGMLAEQVVLDAQSLVHVPPGLTNEEAATLPCAAVTAWNAVVEHGKLKAGETILVLGSGGVSIFALQFARMMGAKVIATTSSSQKAKKLLDLGATSVINYRENPDWDHEVHQLTESRGVDHVVEVGGADTLKKSLKAARSGGRVSIIGNLSGLTTDLNVAHILHKTLTVQGIYVGSRDMFEAMNQAITFNQLKPVIDRVFPFTQAVQALRHMESAGHFGKIVVTAD